MHEGTARLIGNKLGKVHESSFTKKFIIASRFIKFRVDIAANDPIPGGFFFKKKENEDIWIQFKFEKLADFCYTCGVLSHVTGRCKLSSPTMISSRNSIRAKLYGPWLRAQHPGNLMFINPVEDDEQLPAQISKGKAIQNSIAFQDGMGSVGAKLTQTTNIEGLEKSNPHEKIQAARQMCPEVEALHAKLDNQVLFQMDDLKASMLHQVRITNFDPQVLGQWAGDMVKSFATFKAH